ncbi:hypothetical protein GCM10027396_26600 [Insolitispirillum peregrinum]
MERMKAVKTLVVFMGVLLVLGLALLGYGMYSKAGRVVKPSAPAVATASAVSPVAAPAVVPVVVGSFGAVGLGQPEGSRIAASHLNGPVLVLTVVEGGLPDRVILLDTAAGGAILGQVSVQGSPAAAASAPVPVVPVAK